MVSTVALAILIKQSTYIWNLSSGNITLHVDSFQCVFEDVNNEVIIMQDLFQVFSQNLFCKSVVVAVILKKWSALQVISDVTMSINWT